MSTDPEIVVIRSADDPELAFHGDGLPPSGNVTLERLVDDPRLAPSFLWVRVPVGGDVHQVIAYSTYDRTDSDRILLTGTAENEPVTLAAFDVTADSQIWRFQPAGETVDGAVIASVGVPDAAVKRTIQHAIPGAGLELRRTTDPHEVPFRYLVKPVG